MIDVVYGLLLLISSFLFFLFSDGLISDQYDMLWRELFFIDHLEMIITIFGFWGIFFLMDLIGCCIDNGTFELHQFFLDTEFVLWHVVSSFDLRG